MANKLRRASTAGVLLLTTWSLSCGGGGTSGTLEITCADVSTSAMLAPGGEVLVDDEAAADLNGASVSADAKTTVPATAVTIACAEDIVPTGYEALGPAVTFGPAGSWSGRPFTITLPYKHARLPDGATGRHVRVVVKRHIGDGVPFFAPVADRALDTEDPYASRISFRGGELVTYQAVVASDAGQKVMRRYSYRAIVGISMGGNAAMSIGLRHHDKFDLIADLGGEPGPSMKYSLTSIQGYLFGGFCTAADQAAGKGNIGEMCLGEQRPAMTDQHELKSDFEHMLYQSGEGVGLTLNRNLYMKASRDLARAFGNPALYNKDNPYAPPGVPDEYLQKSPAERCGNPHVLHDFFDSEFNPDGSNPVITFCDGGDSPALGLGVFDISLPQMNPAEIFLAVDLNDNGRRDPGEPVITNAYEPYEDVGSDGTADAQETGVLGVYNATTNPDPAGDNYHYLRNPLGTEGNFDWDMGEPYDDYGLDGVQGTCQQGESPGGVDGCYDYGEGDNQWTMSPNTKRWYDAGDIDVMLAAMTPDERDRIGIWWDAGIRDFLNAVVSSNVGAGVVAAKYGLETAVWDSFESVQAPGTLRYDFAKINWSEQPRNNYVRYGNPDARESDITNGDGRHVGTPIQIINRATTAFAWMDSQWPNANRDPIAKAGQIIEDLVFTAPTTGRETPYGLFLPPGYDLPENADKTYPVIYFLHGYGQDPNDLVLLSAVFENYMTNPDWAPEDRFQKFIIVYVDGRCRPNKNGVPVEAGGDGCERGTFYMDAPLGGPARMETNMLDLVDFIDANHRTRAPEMVEVTK